MKTKRVLVVLGGTSGEREVSLDSGRACANALKKIGYKSKNNVSIINAFQRRFRQVLINGKIDKECLIISRSISKN